MMKVVEERRCDKEMTGESKRSGRSWALDSIKGQQERFKTDPEPDPGKKINR